MELYGKLAALEKIYRIYDEFAASLELACKKFCSHCCTTGVTLTTVEGYKIVKKMESEGDTQWVEKIAQASKQPHFQLKITINQLANMCAEGIEPPTEDNDALDTCLFLMDDLCPLYAAC